MNSDAIIDISSLSKVYKGGFKALDDVSLQIKKGEIFALLGPNGAGKTTLISTIAGLVQPTNGQVLVGGNNILTNYRQARAMIGLVPQEMPLDPFLTVGATVTYARGFYGKTPNRPLLEQILRDLSLWDKVDTPVGSLSGGMKRRVLIAKALTNEPEILFLDEPTAGVDVELRKDMYEVIKKMKAAGTTIVLTTHYLEEAEDLADRIGVIQDGKIVLVEEKEHLMGRMGKKELFINLKKPIGTVPTSLSAYNLKLDNGGSTAVYEYDTQSQSTGISTLLSDMKDAGFVLSDIDTKQKSLEDIFIDIIKHND